MRSLIRLRAVASVLVAAAVLTACKGTADVDHAPMASSSSNPAGVTGVRIDRSFALLDAKPFDSIVSGPDAVKLYTALLALPATSQMVACPGDATVTYRLTFFKGSAKPATALATYGGCRVVSFGGKQLDAGATPAGEAFWSALFRAAGPRGAPSLVPPTAGAGSA